jgi:hypothetical protein
VGCIAAGLSNAQIATSTLRLVSNVSGVPQSPQKPRWTLLEL